MIWLSWISFFIFSSHLKKLPWKNCCWKEREEVIFFLTIGRCGIICFPCWLLTGNSIDSSFYLNYGEFILYPKLFRSSLSASSTYLWWIWDKLADCAISSCCCEIFSNLLHSNRISVSFGLLFHVFVDSRIVFQEQRYQ